MSIERNDEWLNINTTIEDLISKNSNKIGYCHNDVDGTKKKCELEIENGIARYIQNENDNVLQFVDNNIKIRFNGDEFILKKAEINIPYTNVRYNSVKELHKFKKFDIIIEYEFDNKNIDKANESLSIVVVYGNCKTGNGNNMASQTLLNILNGRNTDKKLIVDKTTIPDATVPFVYANINKKHYIFYFRFPWIKDNNYILEYYIDLKNIEYLDSLFNNNSKKIKDILPNVRISEYEKIWYNPLGRRVLENEENSNENDKIYIDCRPMGDENEETELYAYTNVKRLNEKEEKISKDKNSIMIGKLLILLIVIMTIWYIVTHIYDSSMALWKQISIFLMIGIIIYGLSIVLKMIEKE